MNTCSNLFVSEVHFINLLGLESFKINPLEWNEQIRINAEDLPDGIYLIQLYSNNKRIWVDKVVISR